MDRAKKPALGHWTLNAKILGAKNKSWDILKDIIVFACYENHHNWELPNLYERRIVSHMFRTMEKSSCTYIPEGPGSILWAESSTKWITLSPIFYAEDLNKVDLENSNRSFSLITLTGEVVVCNYTSQFRYQTYNDNELTWHIGNKYPIIESMNDKIKCNKALSRMESVKAQSCIFNFEHDIALFDPKTILNSPLNTQSAIATIKRSTKESSIPIQAVDSLNQAPRTVRGITSSQVGNNQFIATKWLRKFQSS